MTAPASPRPSAPRIFDRGARLDTGKPGTGLGLAIVRDVAADLRRLDPRSRKARIWAACSPG